MGAYASCALPSASSPPSRTTRKDWRMRPRRNVPDRIARPIRRIRCAGFRIVVARVMTASFAQANVVTDLNTLDI